MPQSQGRTGYYQMGHDAHDRWHEHNKSGFPPHQKAPRPPYLPHDIRYIDWLDGWMDAQKKTEESRYRR